MQHLEVSCAVRRLYRSLGVKWLTMHGPMNVKFEYCLLLLSSYILMKMPGVTSSYHKIQVQ